MLSGEQTTPELDKWDEIDKEIKITNSDCDIICIFLCFHMSGNQYPHSMD